MTRSKAATDGAEPEGVTEPATVTVQAEEYMQRSNVPENALKATAAIHEPTTAILLPSEHVDFAALLENDLHNRIHAIQSGIAALEGELQGKEAKHNATVAEMTATHEADKAKLLARIDNLKTALRMAKSGVAAKDVPT
jgi:hypothetical protein